MTIITVIISVGAILGYFHAANMIITKKYGKEVEKSTEIRIVIKL